jgi:Fe2+ transport system protein FeoA
MILIENIPGLAWKVIDYDEIGDKIYQRLMALGLTEDQLVEHIDSLQSHSLSDVIASITEPSET